ncbi:DEAD/DEAH box helicase [Acholeplasma granularum]|uniref:DEAD/DEAH box helicase n=1 Tax=Acholeplasma granularum TaxID=264635 RepID=UPI00046F67AC|nr:DEAD/DEAH box helicase [Acholeplasma granularum]
MSKLFNDLPILETTKEALKQLGFEEATPIQEQAIPKMIEGLDLIGQAQTGTGKTFAFAIPMVENTDTDLRQTQGLILTPTRELTIQVYKEILKLVKFYPSLRVTTIVGGESYDKQFKELAKKPHIIVATPGRIIDHIDRGTVDLSFIKTLTLDEADEMLKMGFQEDIERILQTTPAERQTVLFSATMPPFIRKIAKNYQRNPEIIKVEAKSLTVDRIMQGYYLVKEKDKIELLKRLLDYDRPQTAIIFVNTKAGVDRIASNLQEAGLTADALHGDLKQTQRNYVMSRFRNKQLSLLIATDVAARGLDVDDVEVIYNFDLPQQDEIYVHRIGRTGRAGKKGKAYTFVTPSKKRMIDILANYTKAEIKKLNPPTADEVYKQQLKQFKQELKHSLKTEQANNLELIADLLNDETTKDHLLNYFLNQVIPVKKNYETIEEIPEKQSRRDRDSRSNDTKSSSNRGGGKYVDFNLNLGKNDGLTPQVLFKFLEKEYGIYSKNIGDIKHHKNETVFGLNKEALKRLNTKKDIVYKGKKVKVNQI